MNYLQGENKKRKKRPWNQYKIQSHSSSFRRQLRARKHASGSGWLSWQRLIVRPQQSGGQWYPFKIFHCSFHSPSFPTPPPRPSFLEPHADPRATSSYPSTRRHVPHANPLRAARPPTVRGSLHYDAPCLEKGRARARASTLRGHKGAKGGERRRPCWRAPARKLTRRDPSWEEADRIKKTQGRFRSGECSAAPLLTLARSVSLFPWYLRSCSLGAL